MQSFAHKETSREVVSIERGVKNGIEKLDGGSKMGVVVLIVTVATLFQITRRRTRLQHQSRSKTGS